MKKKQCKCREKMGGWISKRRGGRRRIAEEGGKGEKKEGREGREREGEEGRWEDGDDR